MVKYDDGRQGYIAKELGLQPHQISVWFQNWRAQCKTKQLEKDYDVLKSSYDKLKADHDSLVPVNENLKNEVLMMKNKLLSREKDNTNIELVDITEPVDEEPYRPIMDTDYENVANMAMVVCKQEDASSVKSGVFDSESPLYAHGNQRCSSLLESGDSSFGFEPELSDISGR